LRVRITILLIHVDETHFHSRRPKIITVLSENQIFSDKK
jgi:hypothetical protein